MLKKTFYCENPCHLSIKHQQLVIAPKPNGQAKSRPVEDLGFIILDNQQITFTQSVIQQMAKYNVAVVFCDKQHHPDSMLFHLDSHQTQTEHFRAQIEASKPLKKQLWKQTVKAKIRNQAALLSFADEDDQALCYLARKVQSGDPDNKEARASRIYWPLLFGDAFRRRRHGNVPNNLLNYGYAVLRAAVARALTGSGLLPTLGIHHHNKYNAYCLADDIMEPYRPFVDKTVWELYENGQAKDELDNTLKAALLHILSSDIFIGHKTRPLMVGLSETTASLARCFKKEVRKVEYPEL